jgi:hypothetical protein
VKSTVKSTLVTSFDIKGIVHKELVLAGQTVKPAFWCGLYCVCVNMCEDFPTNFGDK